MGKSSMFIGMDVHKKTIDITVAEGGRNGEVWRFGQIGGDLRSLDKAVAKLRKHERPMHFVYEAGPCGFVIYRHLTSKGEDCTVVSPAMVPSKGTDRVKTDRRDGAKLARQHRAGELRGIYVPDAQDEAMRDLVRAREDAAQVSKRAKQRVGSFLLRHGRHYSGKKTWGPWHRRWLSEQYFDHAAQRITLEEYIAAVEECEARVERLTEQIRVQLETWHWRPVVEALQALRGVSLIVAATVVAEVGDLGRFRPRELMAYLGLVPSEYSSGLRQRRGAITKTGNAHVRRVLCEGAWAYQYKPALTHHLRKRQKELPKEVRDLAWKAQLRLCARFRRLSAQGKHRNLITTAIARELCGFIWDIGRRVNPDGSIKKIDHRSRVSVGTITLRRRRRSAAAAPSSKIGRAAPARA